MEAGGFSPYTCSLFHRRAPAWLVLTTPILAIGAPSQPAFAAMVLGVHCITTAASLAFVIAARNTDSIFRR